MESGWRWVDGDRWMQREDGDEWMRREDGDEWMRRVDGDECIEIIATVCRIKCFADCFNSDSLAIQKCH